MSFLEDVKNELCVAPAGHEGCSQWETRGVLELWGQDGARRLRIRTDLAAVARRVYGLLRDNGVQRTSVARRPKGGFLVVGYSPRPVEPAGEPPLPRARCCKRAYVRGAFLARGFINTTRHGYHWEIKTPNRAQAGRVKKALDSLGLRGSRVGRWQRGWVVYMKDAGQIADWLGQVGAHSALLEFENARVAKEMRNKVNRRVNYETANLERTASAALEQKKNIRLIERTVGLASLPPGLRVLAEARLREPLASLSELGASLKPPLSKSGASYRMRRIAELARRIRDDHGKRRQAETGPAAKDG